MRPKEVLSRFIDGQVHFELSKISNGYVVYYILKDPYSNPVVNTISETNVFFAPTAQEAVEWVVQQIGEQVKSYVLNNSTLFNES